MGNKFYIRKKWLTEVKIKRMVSFYNWMYGDSSYTKEANESDIICFEQDRYLTSGWALPFTEEDIKKWEYKELTVEDYIKYKKKYNRALFLKIQKLLDLEDVYGISIKIINERHDTRVEIRDSISRFEIYNFTYRTTPNNHDEDFVEWVDIVTIKEWIEEWLEEREDKIKEREDRDKERELKQLEELKAKYN